MEIRVIGEPKEIAALVVAIQERQKDECSVEKFADVITAQLDRGLSDRGGKEALR